MKFIKVIGLVLFFHASLLGVLFFQPGCQTMENGCMTNQSQCGTEEYCQVYADDYKSADDFEYSTDNARVFADNASVNVVADEPMTTKNMRHQPTRPVQGPIEQKTVAATSDNGKSIESGSAGVIYVVKSGDTLWVVAKRNGTSVADLANVNGISRDSILKVGQKLVIPAQKGSAGMIVGSTEGASYTIAKGDTLSEIAGRFHVSVADIKAANNMKDNVIYAGKKIVIPGVGSKLVDAVDVKAKGSGKTLHLGDTYQVKNGDTLSVIAGRYGVTVTDLMKWNNITDAAKLRAGQNLVVKGASSKAVTSAPLGAEAFDKINELDVFIPEVTEDPIAEYNGFELFEDDMLFDTSEEIPVVTITEE